MLSAALAAAFPALAQDTPVPGLLERWEVPCTADGPGLRRELAGNWGESPMLSTAGGDKALELWSNPATGSWTLMVYRTDGTVCVPLLGQGEWVRQGQGRRL